MGRGGRLAAGAAGVHALGGRDLGGITQLRRQNGGKARIPDRRVLALGRGFARRHGRSARDERGEQAAHFPLHAVAGAVAFQHRGRAGRGRGLADVFRPRIAVVGVAALAAVREAALGRRGPTPHRTRGSDHWRGGLQGHIHRRVRGRVDARVAASAGSAAGSRACGPAAGGRAGSPAAGGRAGSPAAGGRASSPAAGGLAAARRVRVGALGAARPGQEHTHASTPETSRRSLHLDETSVGAPICQAAFDVPLVSEQHAGHTRHHTGGEQAADHRAQREPGQVGTPLRREPAVAADLDANAAKVCEAAQRIRSDQPAALAEPGGICLELARHVGIGDELVEHRLLPQQAAHLGHVGARNAHHPRQGREHPAQDLLEGERATERVGAKPAETRVDQGGERQKYDQHCGHVDRELQAVGGAGRNGVEQVDALTRRVPGRVVEGLGRLGLGQHQLGHDQRCRRAHHAARDQVSRDARHEGAQHGDVGRQHTARGGREARDHAGHQLGLRESSDVGSDHQRGLGLSDEHVGHSGEGLGAAGAEEAREQVGRLSDHQRHDPQVVEHRHQRREEQDGRQNLERKDEAEALGIGDQTAEDELGSLAAEAEQALDHVVGPHEGSVDRRAQDQDGKRHQHHEPPADGSQAHRAPTIFGAEGVRQGHHDQDPQGADQAVSHAARPTIRGFRRTQAQRLAYAKALRAGDLHETPGRAKMPASDRPRHPASGPASSAGRHHEQSSPRSRSRARGRRRSPSVAPHARPGQARCALRRHLPARRLRALEPGQRGLSPNRGADPVQEPQPRSPHRPDLAHVALVRKLRDERAGADAHRQAMVRGFGGRHLPEPEPDRRREARLHLCLRRRPHLPHGRRAVRRGPHPLRRRRHRGGHPRPSERVRSLWRDRTRRERTHQALPREAHRRRGAVGRSRSGLRFDGQLRLLAPHAGERRGRRRQERREQPRHGRRHHHHAGRARRGRRL